jgi:hypothetical protein
MIGYVVALGNDISGVLYGYPAEGSAGLLGMRQPIEGGQSRCANVFLRVSRQTGDGDLQTPGFVRGDSAPKNRIECRNVIAACRCHVRRIDLMELL